MAPIIILPDLTIPEEEFTYTASRASGPGGQHVNTTSSRITVRFNAAASPSLNEWQRAKILEKLSGYADKEGIVAVSCETQRSQHANRREALARLISLLQRALKPRIPRKPTRPTLASKVRRVDSKKRRSGIKRTRGKVGDND